MFRPLPLLCTTSSSSFALRKLSTSVHLPDAHASWAKMWRKTLPCQHLLLGEHWFDHVGLALLDG
eukprot:scaffold846_cov252-Pinguiococcus_pyrenoidosus.AAC.14